MDMTQQQYQQQTEAEQAALWNGRAGRAWVDAQASLDAILQPFEDRLVDEVRAGSAQRVLDVGCGTGATTLAVARLLASAKGQCVGVDISEPMIAAARERARRESSPATFICADVQRHVFAPASFDMVISRFGVMFFDSPVQAFENLRQAARGGAVLRALAWHSPAETPFMTTAERAAAPLLPNMPARQPGAPGQFAFADRERVSSILEESGWTGVDIQPMDVECAMPEKDLNGYFTRLGPVGLMLQEEPDEHRRAQVIETVRTAFEPFVRGGEVRFTAACWMIGAHAPSA